MTQHYRYLSLLIIHPRVLVVQTYTFKKFYFHGYVRPNHIVVPKRSKLVYAEAQDVNLGLNLSANQTGVESDLKNNLDGLMGLGIP